RHRAGERDAFVSALRRRLGPRREEGFTLVELLIAMIILTVGILALVAAYTSGYVALNRATRVSSATLIADSQMERFRALNYTNIKLNTTCGALCTQDSTYTSDSTYSSTTQVTGCATTDSTCLSTQTKTGPDAKSYRLDTFIKYSCVTTPTGTPTLSTSPLGCTYSDGTAAPSPVKKVTVLVTSVGGTGLGTTRAVSVREQSSFTSITGQ
ncbi:MAG: type IV pilus modification PilV family protein, partial [Gaiellaceae bacterium]